MRVIRNEAGGYRVRREVRLNGSVEVEVESERYRFRVAGERWSPWADVEVEARSAKQ